MQLTCAVVLVGRRRTAQEGCPATLVGHHRRLVGLCLSGGCFEHLNLPAACRNGLADWPATKDLSVC